MLGTAVVAGLNLVSTQQHLDTRLVETREARRFLAREVEYAKILTLAEVVDTSFAPVPERPQYEVRRRVINENSVAKEILLEIRWTTPSGVVRTESLSILRGTVSS